MFDLIVFIKAVGYLGITAVIFAETGLFIGFFLPGDSLLFTAGFLASQNYLNIFILIGTAVAAAVAGDSVGYAFGRRVGPKIFTREDSILFHKDHVERTRHFYEKHGGKTIILARFIPFARTFAPILAGVGAMRYVTFLSYNIAGAFLWACGLPLMGYFLGKSIPNADHYLLPIVLLIVFVSVLPSIIHIWRDRALRASLLNSLKRMFRRNPPS